MSSVRNPRKRSHSQSTGDDSDDYNDTNRAAKKRKTKTKKGRFNQSDFAMSTFSRVNSRNGRELPNYNEAEMQTNFSGSEDEFEYYLPGEEREFRPCS